MAEQLKEELLKAELLEKEKEEAVITCDALWHIGLFLLWGRRLADDVWRQRTYRQSGLAYTGNGADRSMEKRTCNGFGISGHCFLRNCIILS